MTEPLQQGPRTSPIPSHPQHH